MDEDVEQFLSAVAETPELWHSVDVRVAVAEVDGMWHNLVTRASLKPLLPDNVNRPNDFPRLPYFTVLQEVYPLAALLEIVANVREGHLDIQGHRVHFLTSEYDSNPFKQPYVRSYASIGRDIRDTMRGSYRYGHSLTLSGDEASSVFRLLPRREEGLNAALRALQDPWGGVSDVLLHALEDPSALHGQSSRRVTFVAPLQARISLSDCVLADGVLSYTIRAESKRAGGNCTLVATGIDSRGNRLARRFPLLQNQWLEDGDDFSCTGTEALPDAKQLTLTLQLV